ncbi:phospholipase D-like domain-containing protein [Streptomyces odontomachi]|uniref:phospholipase D-like domain-containing protein n=1 Tax=Streptomyces odontomachi TaxID=2944940 RepID=UPI00210AB386|nr:phospholipase D-like domain-containing protein [Streptomyces sp. ODS25]
MTTLRIRAQIRRLTGLLAGTAAVLAGMLIPAGGSAQAATTATVPTGAVFNKPTGSTAEQQAIRTQVQTIVANADSGSIIRVAMYHLWDDGLANDLVAAKDRGVNVRLVLDHSTLDYPSSYNILKAALGTSTGTASWVKLCTSGSSCLGPAGTGINHNKWLLASSVGGGAQTNVVAQLTSNLTPSNYSKYWNSSVTVAGNADLYNGYVGYFNKLQAESRGSWSYTYGNAGEYKYYFFPRAGSTESSDTIVNALDNVTCRYSDASGAHQTSIHIAMLKITRQAVADKLKSLGAAGCVVDIVYSETDSGTWPVLHSTGLTNRCYQHDNDADSSTPNRIVHSKNMLISGMYADVVQKVMWTGSHNFSGPALRNNDEAMLRITNASVYAAFESNFQAARAAAVPGTSDNVTICKTESS